MIYEYWYTIYYTSESHHNCEIIGFNKTILNGHCFTIIINYTILINNNYFDLQMLTQINRDLKDNLEIIKKWLVFINNIINE